MITLASKSQIRQQLLRKAHVPFVAKESVFQEETVKTELIQRSADPAEVALALAQGKAAGVKQPDTKIVLGCDQVLDIDGELLSKPKDRDGARIQLRHLRGHRHYLLSAAVILEKGQPIWSHIGKVTLTMRDFSDDYLEAYLNRNWPEIQSSVGGYKLEEEGVRLFSKIEGDYFTVLGMPLVEILGHLKERGAIDG